MPGDFFRRAVREGSDAFGPSEYGKRALAVYLHWRLWAGAAMVLAFFWATLPYLTYIPGASASLLELAEYQYNLVPWLLGRPLRLVATLPLTLWFLDRWFAMPRY